MRPESAQRSRRRTVSSVVHPVVSALSRMIRLVEVRHNTNGEMESLTQMLEALPLSTEDFGLACQRLCNAHRYLKSNERGAAQWELKALRQQVRKSQAA